MSDEIDDYVGEHAPNLDSNEVRQFLSENAKPTNEPGTPIEWATKVLQQRQHHDDQEHPSLELVKEEMRRHDERQE